MSKNEVTKFLKERWSNYEFDTNKQVFYFYSNLENNWEEITYKIYHWTQKFVFSYWIKMLRDLTPQEVFIYNELLKDYNGADPLDYLKQKVSSNWSVEDLFKNNPYRKTKREQLTLDDYFITMEDVEEVFNSEDEEKNYLKAFNIIKEFVETKAVTNTLNWTLVEKRFKVSWIYDVLFSLKYEKQRWSDGSWSQGYSYWLKITNVGVDDFRVKSKKEMKNQSELFINIEKDLITIFENF